MLPMMRVVIILLDVLADGGAPELLWELECHAGVCIEHGYAHGKSLLVTTCQEDKFFRTFK